MLPQATKLGELALDFLFPQWCVGCGKEGAFICPSCRNSLTKITPPLCPLCGRPQTSGVLCPDCITWKADINGIRSPFRFEGVIRQAIYQLKYRNLRALAMPLARLLNDYLAVNPVPGDTIVPVPLHRKRIKERGYNQSGLLAKKLGKLSNLPVMDDSLIRREDTPPQARTTSVTDRQRNVAGVFTCKDNRLQGKKVLLVDDVSTSGATIDSCAAALKENGAESVWGLTLAREI